jgi:hypothetical protein
MSSVMTTPAIDRVSEMESRLRDVEQRLQSLLAWQFTVAAAGAAIGNIPSTPNLLQKATPPQTPPPGLSDHVSALLEKSLSSIANFAPSQPATPPRDPAKPSVYIPEIVQLAVETPSKAPDVLATSYVDGKETPGDVIDSQVLPTLSEKGDVTPDKKNAVISVASIAAGMVINVNNCSPDILMLHSTRGNSICN